MSKRLQERNENAQNSSSSSSSSRRAANDTSSSSNRQQQSSRKRKVSVCGDMGDDEKDDMEELKQVLAAKKFVLSGDDVQADIARCSTEVYVMEKEKNSWDSLSDEVKAQCVKACVRLLVMKGTKHDNVNRMQVTEAIKLIDKAYAKHINQILIESRKVINKRFGYVVRATGEFDKNGTSGEKQTFFLTNSVDSPILHSLLVRAEAPSRKAFRAFTMPIFLTLFTSPGRKAAFKTLFANARMIDPRFPETLSTTTDSKSNKAVAAVEGLESDFKSLIARMKSERYIVAFKEREGQKDVQDSDKTEYILGPRFHAEVGLKKCCQMYFMACGEEPDEAALRELEEEEEEANGVEGEE